jgi:predicted nucleic acid-binding protein
LRRHPVRRVGPAAAQRRVFVDSSAWLAFFSARDGNHATATALLQRAISGGVALVTTSLVVAEVHRLVLHRVGIQAAAALLSSMDGSAALKLVFPGAAHHQAARRWLDELSDQVITYTDATSFAVMDAEHCSQAITFDRDFVIAGFGVWRA